MCDVRTPRDWRQLQAFAKTAARRGRDAVSDFERRQKLEALARTTGVPAVDLASLCLDLSVLDLLPRDIADRHAILPLLLDEDELLLAMVRPEDKKVIDELEFVSGKSVVPHVAQEQPLKRLIDHVYSVKEKGATFFTGPNCPPEQTQLEGRDRLALALVMGEGNGAAPDSLDRMPAVLDPGSDQGNYVLVVDDDDAIRIMVKKLLEVEGHEVETAVDGVEALEVLRRRMPKLLVTDGQLPRLHGFELVKRLRASDRYASLPIVVVSAQYKGWRFVQDLRESCGVRNFVEKPFTRAAFLDAVNDELGAAPNIDEGATTAAFDQASRAYEAGRLDDAVQCLEAGVKRHPKAVALRVQLALLYAKKGLIYEAIAALEQALEIDGGHFSGARNLAVFYQQAGFRNKAAEMWMRALNLAPEESSRTEIKKHLISML